jgi:phage protein D
VSVEFPVVILSVEVPDDSTGFAASHYQEQFRKRLISFDYTDSLEVASELELTLSNRDLALIDDRRGNFDAIGQSTEPGNIIIFQFGFAPSDDYRGDVFGGADLSPIRSMTVAGNKGGPDTITLRCISLSIKKLASITEGKIYQNRKISDVVIELLDVHGFDETHRQIQDTKHQIESMVKGPAETPYEFIKRIGRYMHYIVNTTVGVDGKEIFHFHKPGWTPGAQGSGPAFGEPANGMTDPIAGTITYRPKVAAHGTSAFTQQPNDEPSRVLDWNYDYKPDSIPAKAEAVFMDLEAGNLEKQLVGEKDLDSAALSAGTDFDDPILNSKIAQSDAFGGGRSRGGTEADISKLRSAYLFDEKRGKGVVARYTYSAGVQEKTKATDEAKAMLEGVQAKTVEITLKLVGIPKMAAGQIWKLKGFRKFDGLYLVDSARHHYDATTGYTTDAKFKSDGVDGVLKAPSRGGRKPEVDVSLRATIKQEGTTIFVPGAPKK